MTQLRVYFIDKDFTAIGDVVVDVPVGDEIDQRKLTEEIESDRDAHAFVLGFEPVGAERL